MDKQSVVANAIDMLSVDFEVEDRFRWAAVGDGCHAGECFVVVVFAPELLIPCEPDGIWSPPLKTSTIASGDRS